MIRLGMETREVSCGLGTSEDSAQLGCWPPDTPGSNEVVVVLLSAGCQQFKSSSMRRFSNSRNCLSSSPRAVFVGPAAAPASITGDDKKAVEEVVNRSKSDDDPGNSRNESAEEEATINPARVSLDASATRAAKRDATNRKPLHVRRSIAIAR